MKIKNHELYLYKKNDYGTYEGLFFIWYNGCEAPLYIEIREINAKWIISILYKHGSVIRSYICNSKQEIKKCIDHIEIEDAAKNITKLKLKGMMS